MLGSVVFGTRSVVIYNPLSAGLIKKLNFLNFFNKMSGLNFIKKIK
jgi:hypothetical protein